MPEKTASVDNPRKETEIILNGKLTESHQVGTNKEDFPIYENIIILPADDSYGYPTRFCVKSMNRIGTLKSVVSIIASVQCRPWKDKDGRYRYPHDLWAV